MHIEQFTMKVQILVGFETKIKKAFRRNGYLNCELRIVNCELKGCLRCK
ncbi:hypothetical protein [Clostridium beijerinckii]|nr:hypothetical protein [Clostridium beijerinckii]